jgi:ATP-dependent Clp protease protease subunit
MPQGFQPPGWLLAGGQTQDWLHAELFEQRVVFVTGNLDSVLAVRAAAELMTLDSEGTDPIDVYVGSADGTLEAAFSVIDTLDLLKAEPRTHALGEVAGVAVGVLAAGRDRTAAPNARIRMEEPRVQINGSAAQLLAGQEQHKLLLDRFRERLARATGRPIEEIIRDLEAGRYFTAEEALAYGLIDAIAERGR